MESTAAIELIDILVENALRIMRAGFGVNRAESTFFEIIDLLREDTTLKAHFLDKVRITMAMRDPGRLEPGMVPKELIELAAHELRWREFQQLAQQRIADIFGGDEALAIGDLAQHIPEALKDYWADREYYDRYRR
jgi:hypothetical protein